MKIINNLTLDEVVKYHNLEIFWSKQLWEKLWIKRNWEIKVLPLFDQFNYNKFSTQSVIYWIIKLNHFETFVIWYDIKNLNEIENLKFENRYLKDQETWKEYNELINLNTNEVLLSSKDFWDSILEFFFQDYYQWKLIVKVIKKWKEKSPISFIFDIYQKKIISDEFSQISFLWFCYKAISTKFNLKKISFWKEEYLNLDWKMLFSQNDKEKLDKENHLRFENLNTKWNLIRLSHYYIQFNNDNTVKIYDTKLIKKESFYTEIKILNNQFCFLTVYEDENKDVKTIVSSLDWKFLFETNWYNTNLFEYNNYFIKESQKNWDQLVQLLSKTDLSLVYENNYIHFKTLFHWNTKKEFFIWENLKKEKSVYDSNLNLLVNFEYNFNHNWLYYYLNENSSLIDFKNNSILILLYQLSWRKILINQNKKVLRDEIISFQRDTENHNIVYLLYSNWKTEKIDLEYFQY